MNSLRNLRIVLILAFTVLACNLNSPAVKPTVTPDLTIAALNIRVTKYAEMTATAKSQDIPVPIATSVMSATLPSTSPMESEYRMKVDISTSSDWTNLEILNSEVVKDAKITITDGEFTNHTAAPNLIAMNQTLANAKAGKIVRLQVGLWIDANAKADKLDMVLQKGDIGLVILKFYKQTGAVDALIQEITHDFPVGGPTGLNELSFSIPLK